MKLKHLAQISRFCEPPLCALTEGTTGLNCCRQMQEKCAGILSETLSQLLQPTEQTSGESPLGCACVCACARVHACVRAHGQAWKFPSISIKRRSSRKYNKGKHPDYLICNLKCLKDGKMNRNGCHSAHEGHKALMRWWKLYVNFLRNFQPASCFVSRSHCSSISDILLSQAAAFFAS